MTRKNVAVEGLILRHKTGSLISGGSFSITSTPDTKSNVDGDKIYYTNLQFTFSGGSATGFVSGSVQTVTPASIKATATKTKNPSGFVMRLDDFGVMACVGTIPPPTGGTGPVSGAVEISDAGQDKVSAE